MKGNNTSRAQGYIWAILSSVLFGLMAVLVKLALNTGLAPLDIVFFRFFFAAIIFGLYVLCRRTDLRINKSQFLALLLLSLIGYAAMNLTYYAAFNRASLSLTSMLHYIYPVAAVVIARGIYKNTIPPKQYFAVALGVAGAMLLTFSDFSKADISGVSLALLSGVLYGAYAVGLDSPLLKNLNGEATIFYLCCFSAVAVGIVELFLKRNPFSELTGQGLLLILAVALFCTCFAMLMFRQAIVSIGAVPTTILSTLEPITIVILSIVLLRESLTLLSFGGSVLILTAVILTVSKGKDPRKPAAPNTGQRSL
ncbi:MAG: DMT family transporter [Bacillota bacterium]|nr:DMT family transporter [Bacillota bacterium]